MHWRAGRSTAIGNRSRNGARGAGQSPAFGREIVLSGEPLRIARNFLITSERRSSGRSRHAIAGLATHRNAPAGQRATRGVRTVPVDEQLDKPPPAMIADLSAYDGRTANVELEFRSRGHIGCV